MSIPRAKRDSKSPTEYVPGPQNYNTDGYYNNKGQGIKIGTSKRQTFTSELNPGVGTYNLPPISVTFRESPSYRIQGRANNKSLIIQSTPSPLDYEPRTYQASFFTKQAVKFPQSTRDPFSKTTSPGPQDYDVRYKQKREPSYSFSTQKKSMKILDGPGPGQYDSHQFKRSQSIKFQQSLRDPMTQMTSPGPQDYNVHFKQKQEPSYSFGTSGLSYQNKLMQDCMKTEGTPKSSPLASPRGLPKDVKYSVYMKNHAIQPGPADYYTQRKREYKFAHSNGQRSKLVQMTTPGPGQYEVNLSKIDTMSKQNEQKKQLNII